MILTVPLESLSDPKVKDEVFNQVFHNRDPYIIEITKDGKAVITDMKVSREA